MCLGLGNSACVIGMIEANPVPADLITRSENDL